MKWAGGGSATISDRSPSLPSTSPTYAHRLLFYNFRIEHFTGEKLTYENGQRLAVQATGIALDATRPSIKGPQPDETPYPPGQDPAGSAATSTV